MKDEDRYWMVMTGPGINGGLMVRQGPAPAEGQPVNAYVCTIGVTDRDESVDAVLNAGGSCALPGMAAPGVGWLAYGTDTGDTTVGRDPAGREGTGAIF